MDWVVLVKSVPNAEAIRVDRRTGTLVREGVTMFANPFDQRALRVALDQRRPGETVTALSMGPPGAAAPLREARLLGADRSILVSDPAIAGSDAFVTAKVLTAAVQRIGAGLVIAGQWTTDSETGQVPPQLAARLDRHFVTGARRIARGEGDRLSLDVDTETGWARYELRAPAVIGVGEKIAKLRKLTPEELAHAGEVSLDLWSLPDLSILPSEVGLAASPTLVERLVDVAPTRTPVMVSDGTLEERAANVVRHLLASRFAPAPVHPPRPADPSGDSKEGTAVLVTDAAGRLVPTALPVLSELRRQFPSSPVGALWVGPDPSPGDLRRISSAGGTVVWSVASATPKFGPGYAAAAISAVLDHEPSVGAVIVPSDVFGRTIGALLAVRRKLGLTGDAVGFGAGPDGRIRFHKPAFGGGILAVIGTRTRPALATLRAGGHELGAWPDAPMARVRAVRPPAPVPETASVEEGRELDDSWGDLLAARLVVIVGQGAGDPEGVRTIRDLSTPVGAAVGATRKVVDLGWAPRQVQVGLTGLSLSPKVALLVGVGGSMNHLIGLRRAEHLVALNSDPMSPVFAQADVGVVGRWQELLPALIPALARFAVASRPTS